METEKEETADILENLERRQKIKKLLIVSIISVLLIIIIFIGFSAYFYFKSPEKTLGLGANIEQALLSQDGKIAYIKLKGGSNLYNITKVKFSFLDKNGNSYNYGTTEGITEIEVPYKKTIWDYILGIFGKKLDYLGSYNYDVSSDEIGIENFDSITEVSVVFEYETETGEIIETPALDTTRPTNKTTTSGGGGGGGGGTTTPLTCTSTNPQAGYACYDNDVYWYDNCGSLGNLKEDCIGNCVSGECVLFPTCTNDTGCNFVGNFCDGNLLYNCSLGADGCLDRANGSECGSGYYCDGGSCVQGNTFYVSVLGVSPHNGSVGHEFNLSDAQAYSNNHTNDEITFLLDDGDYGNFSLTNSPNRTAWATWKANGNVNFSKIYISNTVKQNAYLKFDGINIQHPNWTPATGDDGDYHADDADAPGYLFDIKNANYIQLLNGKYAGYIMWLSSGMYGAAAVQNSNNVTIKRCEITNVHSGLFVSYCNNFLLDNCYIHKIVDGSGVRIMSPATNVVLQNNHINYETTPVYGNNEPYFPHHYDESDPDWDGVTKNWLHVGSGFSIRSSNVIVRKNIIRGLFAQALMDYDDFGMLFHDMLFENNLFYDTGRIQLDQCTENITVRNNILIGRVNDDGLDWNSIPDRYYHNAYLSMEIMPGYNSNTIEVYNNIFINEQIAPTVKPAYTIGNNIFWHGSSGSEVYNNNFRAVWKGSAPTYTAHGWPNYFEDIGFTGSTVEYTYSSPVQPFFIDPGFYFGPIGNCKDCGKIWDYHLAPGSPGINFGDPNNQPNDSLGSLDSDNKFILDNGPARDAEHHSTGCYEYQEGTNPSLSPFTQLLNFLKGLLTTKTGKAILTGKITGNAVNEANESGESKVPYVILSILAVIILIIIIIIVKIKRIKKRFRKRIRR